MKYFFQPLDRTDLYLRFFEERCRLHKDFVPDYAGYYLGQYDIDAYDASSLHLGIFASEGVQKPIGFARLSPCTRHAPYWDTSLPGDIQGILQEANTGAAPAAPLPLWENYHLGSPKADAFPFCLGGKAQKCVEVGRLMILGDRPSPRLALNFLTYLLALPKFLGIDYVLASHSWAHHRFYKNYFGISQQFSEAYRHGDSMLAAIYDMKKPFKHNRELTEALLATFEHQGYAHAVNFEDHHLTGLNLVNK